jgi:hypothetical protein
VPVSERRSNTTPAAATASGNHDPPSWVWLVSSLAHQSKLTDVAPVPLAANATKAFGRSSSFNNKRHAVTASRHALWDFPALLLSVQGVPCRVPWRYLERGVFPTAFVSGLDAEHESSIYPHLKIVEVQQFEPTRFATAVEAYADGFATVDAGLPLGKDVQAAIEKYHSIYSFLGLHVSMLVEWSRANTALMATASPAPPPMSHEQSITREPSMTREPSVHRSPSGRQSPLLDASAASSFVDEVTSAKPHSKTRSRSPSPVPSAEVPCNTATPSPAASRRSQQRPAPLEVDEPARTATPDSARNPQSPTGAGADSPTAVANRASEHFRRLHPDPSQRTDVKTPPQPVIVPPANYRYPVSM